MDKNAPKNEPEFPTKPIKDKYHSRAWDGVRGSLICMEEAVGPGASDLASLVGAMKYARESENLKLAREIFAAICRRVYEVNSAMLEAENGMREAVEELPSALKDAGADR